MKLNRFSIGSRFGGGFAALLALVAIMAASGIWGLNGATEQTRRMMEVPLAKERLFEEWYRSIAVGVMRYTAIANSEGDFLENQFAPEVKITTARGNEIAKAIKEMPKTAEEEALVEAVYSARKQYLAAREHVSQAKKAGGPAAAVKVYGDEFRPTSTELLKNVQTLLDFERHTLDAMNLQLAADARHVEWQLGVLAAVAILCGGWFAWQLTRSITLPLREAVRVAGRVAAGDLSNHVAVQGRDEVSSLMSALHQMNQNLRHLVGQLHSSTDSIGTASSEIAAGNADLSARTEKAAANLQETAASMEELTVTVRQSAASAAQADSLAAAAASVAIRGGEVVGHVVQTMAEISASSKRIADITSVIDGIAFQTNILALNASVEAARAGEQGRGFAVVADEVRTLAQRSASAAREIKTLINDSVERVSSGSQQVDEAGRTMEEIVASVRRVATILGEITTASSAQSKGIVQVNGSVSDLDTITQQNAALVEESAAAAESMRGQAQHLAALVSKFRLEPAHGS